jgi:membrane protease YdiL (CAAX protease family)
MFTPLLSAVITERLFKSTQPIFPVQLKLNRYFLYALLFPVLLSFLILAVSLLIPENEFGFNALNLAHRSEPFASRYQIYQMEMMYQNYPMTIWMVLFTGLFAAIFPSTCLAYGEERGWCGFLIQELSPLGFWKSSLLTGLIWGLWHSPLIYLGYNFPEHNILGIFLMGISCALISPWMVYLTQKAGHPLAAALFHGSFNGVIAISISFMSYNNDLIIGPFALIGIIVLIPLNILLHYVRKEKLITIPVPAFVTTSS